MLLVKIIGEMTAVLFNLENGEESKRVFSFTKSEPRFVWLQDMVSDVFGDLLRSFRNKSFRKITL